MTLQQDRATGAPGFWTSPTTSGRVEELPADPPCPEDCHFCSGPETD